MSLSKEQIIDRLVVLFPNRVIHREEYESNKIPIELSQGIRKLSRPEGLSSIQWLTANGFFWKETGYIEDDMREGDSPISHENAYSLAESILRRYPLVGYYEMPEDEMTMLLSAAQAAFDKLPIKGVSLTDKEELVLTVGTIELVKSRMGATGTEEADFWGPIYLQYGHKKGISESTDSLIYRKFCAAVRNTFESYGRVMAGEGTQRYYSSFFLHAIAPASSIENFYDILFDFYTNNLDYQYNEEDPCYQALVTSMQKRWDSAPTKSETFQLRSAPVMSGLKALFLERPHYMAALCDKIVYKIDQLIRGNNIETENRWDLLLKNWYAKKTSTERTRLQGEKRERRSEYVATSTDRIFIRFALEKGKVGLFVPRIRLSADISSRPYLKVYQSGEEIYSAQIRISGKSGGGEVDTVFTTQSIFLPLEDTRLDFTDDLQICAEIESEDKVIYTSGSSLYRNYICFNAEQSGVEIGTERIAKNGSFFLFCSEKTDCRFSNDEGVYQTPHPGLLFRVNAGEVGTVTVDGTELFADVQHAGKLRLYPLSRPVADVIMSCIGKEYQIFSDFFGFSLHIPEGHNSLRYQIYLDDVLLAGNTGDTDSDFVFTMDVVPDALHTVKVRDLEQAIVALEFGFVLLPGFAFQLDKQRYLETERDVNVSISYGEVTKILAGFREGADRTVSFQSSDGRTYLIELPLVLGSLGELSLFDLPQVVWYEDIPKTDFVTLTLPTGWKGHVILTEKYIPENSDGLIEIGNFFRSGQRFEKTEMLWMNLTSPEGKAEQIILSTICFEKHFTSDPVVVEDGGLWWKPEDSFMGPTVQTFTLELIGPQKQSPRTLSKKDFRIGPTNRIIHGWYQCIVTIPVDTNASLFSKETKQTLFDKTIYIGDENEIRFAGKELVLTSASYWSNTSQKMESGEIRPFGGRIDQLRYRGESIPPWETAVLPEYEGSLSFFTQSGTRIRFNYLENDSNQECINPVTVWLVNDHRLIMHTPDGVPPYFSIKRGLFISKVREIDNWDSDDLPNPDYFDYIERITEND